MWLELVELTLTQFFRKADDLINNDTRLPLEDIFIPRITEFPRKKQKDVNVHIVANTEEGELRNTFEYIPSLFTLQDFQMAQR